MKGRLGRPFLVSSLQFRVRRTAFVICRSFLGGWFAERHGPSAFNEGQRVGVAADSVVPTLDATRGGFSPLRLWARTCCVANCSMLDAGSFTRNWTLHTRN